MNEHDALLRAIGENPDDDTSRLVFADWLQEHREEERAEFIRVQHVTLFTPLRLRDAAAAHLVLGDRSRWARTTLLRSD